MKFKERLKKLERNIITDYYKATFKNGESKYFTISQLLRFSLNNTREDFWKYWRNKIISGGRKRKVYKYMQEYY